MSQATKHGSGEDQGLLLQIAMEIDVFASSWSYCDRLSSYTARMVSHNRTDSLLHSNLFSSALNELLETAFRFHKPGGNLVCRIIQVAGKDRIELTIPCSASDSQFYRDAMIRLQKADVADEYRSSLFAEGPLDPDIGLLELAVDYGASLRVESHEDSSIRLIADLALEDAIV